MFGMDVNKNDSTDKYVIVSAPVTEISKKIEEREAMGYSLVPGMFSTTLKLANVMMVRV